MKIEITHPKTGEKIKVSLNIEEWRKMNEFYEKKHKECMDYYYYKRHLNDKLK